MLHHVSAHAYVTQTKCLPAWHLARHVQAGDLFHQPASATVSSEVEWLTACYGRRPCPVCCQST